MTGRARVGDFFTNVPFTIKDHEGNVIAENVTIKSAEQLAAYAKDEGKPVYVEAPCPLGTCEEPLHTVTILYNGKVYVDFGIVIQNIQRNPAFVLKAMEDPFIK